MTTYPTYAGQRTLAQIRRWKTFRGMHPTMQERIAGLIEASGGKVGLGQGLRPSAVQLAVFLDRNVPDPNGKYRYDGKRWSKKPGVDAAVPPGSSMHEIGLAADMTGDMNWMADQVARFDLQTFAKVNGEPYHVQPIEIARGRSRYEKDPKWGMPPWDGSVAPSSTSSSSGGSTPASSSGSPDKLTPAYRAGPGDTGAAVDVVIEALIARGQLPDTAASRDSSYDPDDVEVVKKFQSDNGLHVDGMVGPQTWGSLLQVVKPGDEGPHVRVLQATLIGRRLIRDTSGNRDGKYGDATQDVVRQFQSTVGLKADREVGKVTWTSLIGERKQIQVRSRGAVVDDDPMLDEQTIDDDDFDFIAYLDGRPAE